MKLTFKDKFFYGFGSLGYATVAQTLSNFIMFFGTSVLGISGSLMGLAVSIGVLWDAVSDPILGHFSDKTTSAMGKRHPYLIVGTLGMCAVNLLIWLVPQASPEIVKFIWILFSLLLVQTFCTFFSTPYLALGFDITKDPNQQTSLQSFKTVFYLLGMMLPSVFMFVFMPSKNSQMGQFLINGYVNIAYVSSIICLVCGLVTIFGTFKFGVCCKVKTEKNKTKLTSVFSDFFTLLKKKEYRYIILGYSVSLIASTALTAAGLHMFTYSFHFSSKELSFVMASLILAAIFSQVVWNILSKKRGKKQTLIFGLCIGILGIVLIWFLFMIRNLFPTNVLLYLTIPLIVISGFGTGVLYALPISIFCDVLAKDEEMKQNDKTATYAGIMTLSNKLSDAFALFFIGLMLDFVKFDSSSPVQSNSVQAGLGYIVILGVAISLTLSIYFYKKIQD
ncbi:MAG: MFS transporter [Clostridia bacterium]|nr:MFS transporter [Clostridia bacterium]